jgi:2-polyprenyl-6-methoxyphenol hydroxylase-like FAD-dependent oxidoreductase
MNADYQADIVIAGAGPVGMSLAIDAALRGLRVAILEQRAPGAPPSTKCNTVASRTLEVFRRFGIADQVRAAGLPDDYPTDFVITTALGGKEIGRIRMPSRAERSQGGWPDSTWETPEPVVRASQLYLEPILYARMLELPGITVLNSMRADSFEQDADGVTLTAMDVVKDVEVTLRGRFLVGCDGGRSAIRKQLGVRLTGDDELSRTRSSLIRSKDVLAKFGDQRPAWMTHVLGRQGRGTVIAIDGRELWLVHRATYDGDFNSIDLDGSLRDVLGMGPDWTYELLNHEDWVGRRMVAERFREQNVFIAGDAAHLWVPLAGYGMNAGVADAMNLSFVLDAFLKGWADPAILDAHEAERHPITEQVSRFAAGMGQQNRDAYELTDELLQKLEGESPEDAAFRSVFGAAAEDRNRPQFAPAGLNFGYYYDASPLIAYDDEAPPSYSMGQATPSTAPGARMPHFWVDEARTRSIYDLLGPDYTLLSFEAQNVTSLSDAFHEAGVPLKIVNTERPNRHEFKHRLLIVRQDQHIVWRGNSPPEQSQALVARLRGALPSPSPGRQPALASAS